LYNRSNATVDLSNYILTDNDLNLEKWRFPEGTTMAPNSYLIVWADENGSQGDFHANFKLSASNGERLSLLDANGAVLDEVSFGTQMTDSSWARLPNGTGSFVTTYATFAQNNENALATNTINQPTLRLYPNPTKDLLHILLPTAMPQKLPIQIIDMYGQVLLATEATQQHIVLATQQLPSGLYVVRCGEMSTKLIIK
ncbi:MAG TPA: lamin tail domain-containing protein, partial [Chitinophagales bacterium]|nr:lamin tail domain-containing protein [Chitinophagales bacterium]